MNTANETMQAIVCREHGDPEVMQYETIPRPQPAEGELLVQTEAIGVNYVDTMRRSGRHPAAPATPFTPGIELCGRVAAVGSGVGQFRAGDRVIGRCVTHGAYAEFVAVAARFAVPCPDELAAEEAAAMFVNGQTAYHALVTKGQVQPGESVLVTAAAGGVGTCAVQIAKALGATVIATAGSAEKLELAKRLGADEAVNYRDEGWPGRVLNMTDGRGIDVILESVGGETAQQSLTCWAAGGRIVVFGKASGTSVVVTGDDLLFGNRTAYGLAVGLVIEDEPVMRGAMAALFDWHAAGKLRFSIGHRFPLREAAEAHRLLEARRSTGKIVLVP